LKNINQNIDKKVINDFGQEWNKFDQSKLNSKELKKLFHRYFNIFPKNILNKNSTGFDLGCGSGRWAYFIAPKIKKLNCIDPSKLALKVSKKNLVKFNNISFFDLKVSKKKIKKNSQDFGYCLGVLHHTSDINVGLKFCNRILKKNAPFLIYLYYNFDNRGFFYKLIWKVSNIFRIFICQLPFSIKKTITDIIALIVYYPLAKLSMMLNIFKINTSNIPLDYYKNESLYTMRTDSLDRFGTKLENRFSKIQIKNLLFLSGFKDIKFSDKMPYWVAICKKK